MSIEEITIKKLRNSVDQSDFNYAYNKLMLGQTNLLNDSDIQFLFKLSLIFLSYGDYSLAKLGYRIILRYSSVYKDYTPLYDVSINKGYIPISKFIETTHFNSEAISERFFNTFFSAYKDNFKQDNIFLSHGQRTLIDFSSKSKDNFVLVAPTSYGKSEIIISKVIDNIDKKICIVVPSKALLAQTKRRLLNNKNIAQKVKRVITHPEMYKGSETKFVAVLTQERLLRLLQKHPNLTIDLVLLDEAHNLLKGESRATLLAQVLLITLKRNQNTVLNFFTPFIAEGKNLHSPYADYSLDTQSTTEYLKVERYYHLDFHSDKKLFLYDQFLNKSIPVDGVENNSEVEFLKKYKAAKNIVYLNRPKDIERLAKSLSQGKSIDQSEKVLDLISAIADFLHPDYNLLKCIRAGVVYHHGGVPDVIRLYVENIFTKISALEFIVTNSTLLEGVNIPAEKIFILSNKIGRSKFTKSQFKNLIGRVCRFSEVFSQDGGNLDLLEPEIYLIKGDYADKKSNIISFLQTTAKSDIRIQDDVENLMLLPEPDNLSVEEKQSLKSSLEYLENIEPNTVKVKNAVYVTSEIAKLCFKNNVYDFDIIESEKTLDRNLAANMAISNLQSANDVMEAIYKIFIKDINITDENFKRLNNEPARKFYSMILEWRTSGSSYKQMIGKFISYWNGLTNKIIFAGSRWGEITFDEERVKTLYVDLSQKTEADKVNLAILRIKEEQDYVDNNLIKYIEIFNDLDLMNSDFYEKIKYGTSDKNIICLLKNGFSLDLARCVSKLEYRSFLRIVLKTDEVYLDEKIIGAMEENGENQILIFEATYHIN